MIGIIAMAVLAAIGWIKGFFPTKRFLVRLIILAAGLIAISVTLYFQINQAYLDKYKRDSGKLIFSLKKEIDHPVFAIGGAKFRKSGDKKFILFDILGGIGHRYRKIISILEIFPL